ncbi:MAG: hypothetical protein Ct9H300mP8_12240 [Gammaproteobacteria bacterium]|nr:MAG: hypothetical protein Ct9H300mP8_12240 [Gammaproteobacteria bacterium]
MRPLEGIKVLDFTHVLAGPFATRLLGDMGADVVKINSVARATAINATNNPYYTMWNRNKRALALDMSRDEAKEICGDLCAKADVVIDNFSVGVLDRGGVGYDVVCPLNPRVLRPDVRYGPGWTLVRFRYLRPNHSCSEWADAPDGCGGQGRYWYRLFLQRSSRRDCMVLWRYSLPFKHAV